VALELHEVPTNSRSRTRAPGIFLRWLEHPRLPVMLALGAVLVMLPALNLGLVLDDLPLAAQFNSKRVPTSLLLSRPSGKVSRSRASLRLAGHLNRALTGWN